MALYRTAKLWIMYMHLIGILRSLIWSAHTGNWKLYLQSGHNNYVKLLVLYLKKVEKLEETHPAVYAKFLEMIEMMAS